MMFTCTPSARRVCVLLDGRGLEVHGLLGGGFLAGSAALDVSGAASAGHGADDGRGEVFLEEGGC